MRVGIHLKAALLVLVVFMSGCASISSELMYKAISKGDSCKLERFHWVWKENNELSLATAAQYRLIDQKRAFTAKEEVDGQIALSTIVAVFRTHFGNEYGSKAGEFIWLSDGLCYLVVTPIRAVHDVRGGDEIELKASIVAGKSRDVIWLTKYKVRSTKSGMSMKLVDEFNNKLKAELKSDGYLN